MILRNLVHRFPIFTISSFKRRNISTIISRMSHKETVNVPSGSSSKGFRVFAGGTFTEFFNWDCPPDLSLRWKFHLHVHIKIPIEQQNDGKPRLSKDVPNR